MAFTSNDIFGFDYVQHYTGDAKHTAVYYAALYGFDIVGYMGPETGVRDRISYLLKQRDLMFTITSPIVPDHDIYKWLSQHGDGVAEITMRVANVQEAIEHAASKGAEVVLQPEKIEDDHGVFHRGAIKIYGDTTLTLLNREHYKGHLPGYEAYDGPQFKRNDAGLVGLDHIVGNVETGKMNYWADFFENVLDLETFIHFDKGDISTKYSALVSKVVRSKNGAVKLPINEPAEGLKKSQIEEYLDTNYGPGVQHLAIITNDIINSIGTMMDNGVRFIDTPGTYYEVIGNRADNIDEAIDALRKHNILIDRDEDGYLLQLFTQPVNDRPTLFFEFIQRKGCQGFGQNNFQSLFESIEREQAKRGNL